jgi:HAE1 family hydrophobic/amphiphilic exporter-1
MGALFVRRPIIAIVIAILTTIAGLVAMTKLPTAQYPDIVPPQIQVSTTYTGRTPSRSSSRSRRPRAADERRRLHDLHAVDERERRHDEPQVTFDVETDSTRTRSTPEPRAQAQPNLPPDVNQFGLTSRSRTASAAVVSLYSPQGTYDALFLGNYATSTSTTRSTACRASARSRTSARRLRHAHLGQARRLASSG